MHKDNIYRGKRRRRCAVQKKKKKKKRKKKRRFDVQGGDAADCGVAERAVAFD